MIQLRPYIETDFSLLEKENTREQKKYVGGPESAEKLISRHRKYVDTQEFGKFRMYIILLKNSEPAGHIGYWEKTWRNHLVYETGWGVFPELRGKGIATDSVRLLIDGLRIECKHQFLHAFPSVSNESSNRLCKKVGFTLIEECDFEYPPGSFMRSNDWCFDLFKFS